MKIVISSRKLRKKSGVKMDIAELSVYPPTDGRPPCDHCRRPSTTTIERFNGTKRYLCGYHYIVTGDLYALALKHNDTNFLDKVRPYLEANAP